MARHASRWASRFDLELTVSGDNQGYEVGAWDGDDVNLTPEAGVFR